MKYSLLLIFLLAPILLFGQKTFPTGSSIKPAGNDRVLVADRSAGDAMRDLPVDSIRTYIQNNFVYPTNLSTLSGASNWRIFYTNGSGVLYELTLGAPGTVLKSNGVSAAPSWQSDATGSGGSSYTDSIVIAGRHVPGDSLMTDDEIIAALEAQDNFSELSGTVGDLQIASGAVDGGPGGEIADNTVDANDIDETDDYTWTGVHGFANATVVIPNSDNPTTASAGRIALDNNNEFIEFGANSRIIGALQFHHNTIIQPDSVRGEADAIQLFRVSADAFPHGIVLKDITVSSTTGYTSETFAIEAWSDPQGSLTDLIESITISGYEQSDDGTLGGSGFVPAGYYIFVNLDDTPEDVPQVSIDFTYYIYEGN